MNWSDKALDAILDLIPWDGNESCAFLVGKDGCEDVLEVWPTPSLQPSPEGYSIGRNAWIRARQRAEEQGKVVIGTIHTHPLGPPGPSRRDESCARYLRPPESLRAVWHPRSGRLITYNRQGVLDERILPRPLWMRLLAALVFD